MAGIEIDVNGDPIYRAVGIVLAVLSGLLIGISFILKKKGLISSRVEGEEDGHGYLKSTMWWAGMILMALGEITNFVAYILAPAVLVTPLGALSVVVSAVLSSVFLKERLNFHGKIGCIICLLGSVIVVLHAPEQSAPGKIDQFMELAISPGFLTYTILVILISIFLAYRMAPKHGKKHPIIYISICSFIGSLSVVTLQAVGSAIITSISGDNQFTHWFIYLLIVFVVLTIITQINYLNKALNEFVTAEITPMYYVTFTTATIVSSAILYKGFATSPISIVTLILAFFCICGGVIILQTSRMYETLALEEPEMKEKTVNINESQIEENNNNSNNSSRPTGTISNLTANIIRNENDPSTHTSYTLTSPENLEATESVKVDSNRMPTPHPKNSSLPVHIQRTIRPQASRTSTMTVDSGKSMLVKLSNLIHPEKDDHLKKRTLFTDEQLEASSLYRKPSITKFNNDALPGLSPGCGLASNSTVGIDSGSVGDMEEVGNGMQENSPNSLIKNLIRTVSNPTIRTRLRSKSNPSRPLSQFSMDGAANPKYARGKNIIVINEEPEQMDNTAAVMSPTEMSPTASSLQRRN